MVRSLWDTCYVMLKVDWVMKVDADNYVIMENLHLQLSKL